MKLDFMNFQSDNCSSCQTMEPIVNKIKERFKSKVEFFDHNTDTNPQTAAAFGVRSVPAFMIFKNGIKSWETAGLQTEKDLIEAIEQHIEVARTDLV